MFDVCIAVAARAVDPARAAVEAGYKAYLRGPSVVLESGLLHGAQDWVLVQPEVSKFTRVCSYDRAGYGWSQYRSGPRTSTEIAQELAAALEAAGERPPHILVGHSLGGILVRRFAVLYPGKVAGMVLVDSSHEQQLAHFAAPGNSIQRSQQYFRKQTVENEFGYPRLLGGCGQDPPRPDLHDETVFLECGPERWLTALHEIEIFDLPPPLPPAGSFGDLPLEVLTRDMSVDSDGNPAAVTWLQLQRELAAMSNVGNQHTVRGSSHFIQLDKPDVVVAAIRKVWGSASHSSPQPVISVGPKVTFLNGLPRVQQALYSWNPIAQALAKKSTIDYPNWRIGLPREHRFKTDGSCRLSETDFHAESSARSFPVGSESPVRSA
jgi:pimeloyl-ACP methyl ester carboxylesterase